MKRENIPFKNMLNRENITPLFKRGPVAAVSPAAPSKLKNRELLSL
jgi:hypothetical protein